MEGRGKDQILNSSVCDFKYSLAEIIHSFIKNSLKLHLPKKVEESCHGNDQKMRMLLELEQMKTKWHVNSVEDPKMKPPTNVTGRRDNIICGREATVRWAFLGAKWVLLCRKKWEVLEVAPGLLPVLLCYVHSGLQWSFT